MLSRASFALITLFWVTMNVLLWRAEYGSSRSAFGALPAELVWRKVLTSPDSSSLNVVHRGRRVGFCRWSTGVGEQWGSVTDRNLPAGAPKGNRSYRLQLEGSVMFPELTNHVRFEGSLKVGSHHQWEEFDARVRLGLVAWLIHGAARDQRVRLTTQQGEAHWQRSFTFSELQSPRALLGQLAGPLAGEWLYEAGLSPGSEGLAPLSLEPRWTASEDSLRIGRAQTPVYRLQTQLLDRYQITILVSRVGEILRVELPGELVLVNDQLTLL